MTKRIKYLLFLVFCFFKLHETNAQENSKAELLKQIQSNIHDTLKCRLMNNYIESENDETQWPEVNERMKRLTEKGLRRTDITDQERKVYKYFYAASLNNLGYLMDQQGYTDNAIAYYNKSLKYLSDISDQNGVAVTLNNIGYTFHNKGNISKALYYYERSLVIREKINDTKGIANSLVNLGVLYEDQGDIQKALDQYNKSLQLRESIHDSAGIASSLNNIAIMLLEQERFKDAMGLLERSRTILLNIHDLHGLAQNYLSVGEILEDKNELNEALVNYFKSKDLYEQIGDKQGTAVALNKIGQIYIMQKNFPKAEDNCKKSLDLSVKLGFPENIMDAASLLHIISKRTNNMRSALEYYELQIKMRDSIENESNRKASIRTQIKHEYEKKAMQDSVSFAKENAIKNAELKKQQAELHARKNVQLAIGGGILMACIFGAFIYNRYKLTQKQKYIIEQQKNTVEEQKKLVEEKQKELLDSIRYAKRIQSALMPSDKYISLTVTKSRNKA